MHVATVQKTKERNIFIVVMIFLVLAPLIVSGILSMFIGILSMATTDGENINELTSYFQEDILVHLYMVSSHLFVIILLDEQYITIRALAKERWLSASVFIVVALGMAAAFGLLCLPLISDYDTTLWLTHMYKSLLIGLLMSIGNSIVMQKYFQKKLLHELEFSGVGYSLAFLLLTFVLIFIYFPYAIAIICSLSSIVGLYLASLKDDILYFFPFLALNFSFCKFLEYIFIIRENYFFVMSFDTVIAVSIIVLLNCCSILLYFVIAMISKRKQISESPLS